MAVDMTKKKVGEEDDFGFEVDTGPNPTDTGLNLQGEPNPPYIVDPNSVQPDLGIASGTDGTGSMPGSPDPSLGMPFGTDGTGSMGDAQPGLPQLTATADQVNSFDTAFGDEPELTATDGGPQGDAGQTGGAEFGFETDEMGSGGANQPSAYIAPPNIDVAMPEFQLPTAERDRMGINDELSQYAVDFMRSPTRYDMDVVKSAVDAIGARMARVRQDTGNDVQAFLAGRGILGTTAGGELYADHMAQLSEQEQADLASLRREQALTAGQDRALAGQYGLDVGKFGETQYQFDIDTQLRNRSLELQKYGIDTNKAIAMAQLEQNAQQFGLDYALRERAIQLEAQGMNEAQARFEAELEFRQMQQAENEAYRRDVFGFEQDEALRDWQWQYDYEGIKTPSWLSMMSPGDGNNITGDFPDPGYDANGFADWDTNKNGKWDSGEQAPSREEYEEYKRRHRT